MWHVRKSIAIPLWNTQEHVKTNRLWPKMKLFSLMPSKLRNTKPDVETVEWKSGDGNFPLMLENICCVGGNTCVFWIWGCKQFYFIQLLLEHWALVKEVCLVKFLSSFLCSSIFSWTCILSTGLSGSASEQCLSLQFIGIPERVKSLFLEPPSIPNVIEEPSVVPLNGSKMA